MDIDLKHMEWIARASSDGESYIVMERGVDYRIGIAARNLPEGVGFALEFLVRVLDRRERISDALKGLGYSLRKDDEGWICSEKALDPDIVQDEMKALKDLMEMNGFG
jgi:hypothetical protein